MASSDMLCTKITINIILGKHNIWFQGQQVKIILSLQVQFLHIDGLMQDCNNSIANALELLQSCTKPSIYPAYDLLPDVRRSAGTMLTTKFQCSPPMAFWQ